MNCRTTLNEPICEGLPDDDLPKPEIPRGNEGEGRLLRQQERLEQHKQEGHITKSPDCQECLVNGGIRT
eukprot:2444006-Amphidinium_carterae.1